MPFGFINSTIGSGLGFSKEGGSPPPPVFYGVLGQEADLPSIDFTPAPNWVICVFFACEQDAFLFTQKIKLKSLTREDNRMVAALYKENGSASNGMDKVQSSDIITFGTTPQTLTFNHNDIPIQNGVNYGFAFQAEYEWQFYYDVIAEYPYALVGEFPFGELPASFSGAATFNVVCQMWGDYFYY